MLKWIPNKVLLGLTMIANIIYIIWRIFYTIPEGKGYISLFFAIGLLAVEVLGMFEMFIHFHGMTQIMIPEKPAIDEDLYPHIDVLIATYNEPVDLVQKTINGCIRMQYPDKSKVHIYVCDDGCRKEMEAIAKKMGVGYLIRAEHKHAKAGNLNNAMKFTTSPLLVTFDADMIPMHQFLMSTIPYFLKNEQAKKDGKEANYPEIGFIQTPQSFYNTDLFQFNLHSENRIPNEQDYFYRDIQTAKNATNTVIYGGSNTVISRVALDSIGGFFTNSITEDFATGMLIQSKGYRCYALNTALASGLSPDDLKSLMKQRERWGRGCIQTARRANLLFLKGLTIWQKLSYFSSITYWYSSIKRFFYIMSPIVFSVFGIFVVDCELSQVVMFWLPTYLLTNATIKKFSNNIRNTRWTNIYETIMFQALMLPVILETFCISQNKFLVTKKDKKKDADRTYQIKQALPFAGYIILSCVGIFNMIRQTFITESPTYFIIIFWLVTNLFSLSMAAFFLLGRRQYRQSDRYVAEVDGKIMQNTLEATCKTVDISEEGVAFLLDKPEYVDPNQEFTASFHMQAGENFYECEFQAKIAQVIQVGKKWKYACYITSIDEKNRDEWNAIVHDRLPSLPQNIVESRGFYEDLEINIRRRAHKTPYFSRKTARLTVEQTVKIQDIGNAVLKNFNYQFLVLQFLEGDDIPEQIQMELIPGISLTCKKAQNDLVYHGILYEIENIGEIMEQRTQRTKLTNFMENAHFNKQHQEIKKQKEERVSDEVRLMDFVS